MQIFKFENLEEIIDLIKAGGVVIFPTETSYGLGCVATNQKSVDKIFAIKGRVGDKPLLVVVPDVAMAKKYLEWNATLDNLAKKYWPGALTIVGKCRKKIFGKNLVSGAVGKDNTVAVRVTAHPFLKLITEKLGVPLVATSANLADAGEIYDSAEAIKIFANLENAPDAIVDAGVLPKNLPSTIVSVVDDNIKVLRQGSVRL